MTGNRTEWPVKPIKPGKKRPTTGSVGNGPFILIAFVGSAVIYDAVRIAQFFTT